ncbi:MAG: CusA/CzcA family heavy metal efflux RND transporter [Myxococcales bacterium]|nr:CusA/CzcA family heavy metal efflux RND transporter [Myxococcales bacterium]
MWNALIGWSLHNRVTVLLLAAVLVVWGSYTALQLDVDVLPDVNAPTVAVLVQAPGASPDEVETSVTVPLETALAGAPGLRRIRSSSGIGIAVIWAEFAWDTDPYRARQVVTERLGAARGRLPPGTPPPTLAPMSSIMGEILFVGLSAGEQIDPMDLRRTAEWDLRRRLLAVPGVAQVTPIGGAVRRAEVVLEPATMERLGIGHQQIVEVLRSANRNAPGGFVTSGHSEYVVRGVGRARTLDDLGRTVVGRVEGVPVLLEQLAQVRFAPAPVRGTAAVDGRPAVVLAVQKQPEANTLRLTAALDGVMDEVERQLPQGMVLHRDGFRQARFIDTAIANVRSHLLESALLVVILLTVFLANWRTTVISLVALPLSLLAGVVVLSLVGAGFDTMTLGGLAIAIGALVDDAIIDVENVFRRLKQRARLPDAERPAVIETVYAASVEIRSSIVVATAIITVVFVPLFFFDGLEGRLLRPLGTAYVASLLASLVVAVTVTPVLCSLLLTSDALQTQEETWTVQRLRDLYRPVLRAALEAPRVVLGACGVGVMASLVALALFGRSFLPAFNEGAFTVAAATAPGTPLQASDAMVRRLEARLLELPMVQAVVRRTGRAEQDEHAQDVQFSELEVTIVAGVRRREAAAALREAGQVPGLVVSVGQPIGHRIEHMLSGVKTSMAIKVFGDDLGTLRQTAHAVRAAVSEVEGLVDLSVEQQTEVPHLMVRPLYGPLSVLGLSPGEVSSWVQTATAGQPVGQWWEEGRAMDLVVRYPERYRASVEAFARAPIDAEGERFTALSQVASVRRSLGPNVIQREDGRRRLVVTANVVGRDVSSVSADIEARLPVLPEGTTVQLGGQAQSAQDATRTIAWLSLVAVLAMFTMLWSTLRSARDASLVLVNLPLALMGGVAVVALGGGVLSVASLVGFVTLFGIATRNGVLLVTHYHHLLRYEGASLREAVERGSEERLVPVLMTALGTALALVPIAWAAGEPGAEIQGPMAAVILGGLATSTSLVLVVLPSLYLSYGRGRPETRATPSRLPEAST